MSKTALGLIAPFILLVTIAYTSANRVPLVSSCQESPEPYNDWDDHIGSVESIRIEDAELSFTEKPHLRQISRFNPRGQKIEKVLYRDDGVALPKSTYSYDSTGHIIKAHHYQINGSISLENSYTYGSNGKLNDDIQRNLDDNRILSRKSYSHDEKRNLTEVSDFDWDDKLRFRISFVRNSQCKIIEAYGYNPNGSLRGRIIFSYDDKNNVIESITYSRGSSVEEKRKNDYEFDNRGNWIKQVSSKWVIDGGKGFYKPERATYRKITYY